MNKHKCFEDKCSNMKFRYLYIHTHKYQQTYISTHIQTYIHPYNHTYVYIHIYIHIPTYSCTYIFIYHSKNLFLNLFARSKYFPRLESFGSKVNRERERNVLFNDALNTFYLRLYGVGHMAKDHSDSERGNALPPHGLLFPINKGSFICTIPQTG